MAHCPNCGRLRGTIDGMQNFCDDCQAQRLADMRKRDELAEQVGGQSSPGEEPDGPPRTSQLELPARSKLPLGCRNDVRLRRYKHE